MGSGPVWFVKQFRDKFSTSRRTGLLNCNRGLLQEEIIKESARLIRQFFRQIRLFWLSVHSFDFQLGKLNPALSLNAEKMGLLQVSATRAETQWLLRYVSVKTGEFVSKYG